MASCHTAGIYGLLLTDLMCLSSCALRCCVGKQLNVAALVEQVEPVDGLLDRLTDSQEAMVAQQCSASVAECMGDIVAFVSREDDAFAVEDDVVL